MKNKVELNEKIIFECRPHWASMIVPTIISLFFLLMFICSIIGDRFQSLREYAMFLVPALVIFFVPFLQFKTNKLVLTDKRIYGRTGIIKTQSLSSPISKIQTVNINKSALGRVLGYSDLVIHCITGIYDFKKVTNAQDMQNAILNSIK